MPSPDPPADLSPDSPAQATSYFELERRRAGGDVKLGGQPLPPLPASSPWGAGPGPGDELPIDRSEDSDVMGVAIDDLSR
jgi:hypothetical protein